MILHTSLFLAGMMMIRFSIATPVYVVAPMSPTAQSGQDQRMQGPPTMQSDQCTRDTVTGFRFTAPVNFNASSQIMMPSNEEFIDSTGTSIWVHPQQPGQTRQPAQAGVPAQQTGQTQPSVQPPQQRQQQQPTTQQQTGTQPGTQQPQTLEQSQQIGRPILELIPTNRENLTRVQPAFTNQTQVSTNITKNAFYVISWVIERPVYYIATPQSRQSRQPGVVVPGQQQQTLVGQQQQQQQTGGSVCPQSPALQSQNLTGQQTQQPGQYIPGGSTSESRLLIVDPMAQIQPNQWVFNPASVNVVNGNGDVLSTVETIGWYKAQGISAGGILVHMDEQMQEGVYSFLVTGVIQTVQQQQEQKLAYQEQPQQYRSSGPQCIFMTQPFRVVDLQQTLQRMRQQPTTGGQQQQQQPQPQPQPQPQTPTGGQQQQPQPQQTPTGGQQQQPQPQQQTPTGGQQQQPQPQQTPTGGQQQQQQQQQQQPSV